MADEVSLSLNQLGWAFFMIYQKTMLIGLVRCLIYVMFLHIL
ncbi:hypothetical protein AO369_0271 [Moraxella catarrhalis]|nr:hypothetical protein AO369_0271 [Moraxella catarrhalis]